MNGRCVTLLTLAICIVATLSAGCTKDGNQPPGQPRSEPAVAAPEVSIDAGDLVAEYTADATQADNKFKGKVCRISGKVTYPPDEKDEFGYAVIYCDRNEKYRVALYFSDDQQKLAARKLARGDRFTVLGRFSGRDRPFLYADKDGHGSTLQVYECRFVTN